jgi:hypothetical protein
MVLGWDAGPSRQMGALAVWRPRPGHPPRWELCWVVGVVADEAGADLDLLHVNSVCV